MEMQKTIQKEVVVGGNGLHTGKFTEITIKPAMPGAGIVFVRTDKNPPVEIPATLDNIGVEVGGGRQTTLVKGDTQIRTIEHLMAAFHGLGIDNAIVEIGEDELPGLDGSAKGYVEPLLEIGFQLQDKPREYLTITEPIFLTSDKCSMVALPDSEGLKLSYTLSYQHKDLKDQFCSMRLSPDVFMKELAPARTFCLKEEALLLKSMGYGQGATLENTLVFEDDLPLENTLRFPNEACRHKVVDLFGDLFLLGRPLRAHVIACRTGHLQNVQLMKNIATKLKVRKETGPMKSKNKGAEKGSHRMDIEAIKRVIPHRDPFLLIDEIIEMVPSKSAVGIKNVLPDEPYFKGHFPGHPVMPGVLILESLAQVGGVLMLSQPQNRGKIAYFMTIEDAKFRNPVHPGDQLKLVAEIIKLRAKAGLCSGKAYVEDKLVCEAVVKFAIVDP